MVSAKRKRAGEKDEGTPRKSTRSPVPDELENDIPEEVYAETPSKRKRTVNRLTDATVAAADAAHLTTPKKALKSILSQAGTPRSQRKVLFETPTKAKENEDENGSVAGTPTIVRNADRSARRKSARRLIERTIYGDSDEEAVEEEDTLARQIWAADETGEGEEEGEGDGAESGTIKVNGRGGGEEVEEGEGEVGAETAVPAEVPETPVKKRGRGRPKGSKNKQRTPSPVPSQLPPQEQYFWQNRPGGVKTSNHTVGPSDLLDHDRFFAAARAFQDNHAAEQTFLADLHARAFDQWAFELDEGFNLCLHGYGSKRALLRRFAAHLHSRLTAAGHVPPRIVLVNGADPSLTPRDLLATIAGTLVPAHLRLPQHPAQLLALILSTLALPAHQPSPASATDSTPRPGTRIHILLSALDSPTLPRRHFLPLLATLAPHPAIRLCLTTSHPLTPLLFDLATRAKLRLLHHDATTFQPYDAAGDLDAVEAVNELLGRSARRGLAGRDGVAFVLRSLPENARSLFRILCAEQLAGMIDDEDAHAAADPNATTFSDSDDGDSGRRQGQPRRHRQRQPALELSSDGTAGVEYRVLYHKAVEEFVCSSEVGFRTLLKEFQDHRMVESRIDAGGAERLLVPFRRDELEALLVEELVE